MEQKTVEGSVPMAGRSEYPSFRDNIAYETFYVGAIGGSVVAILFLLLDALAGQALFTPSVAGSALFLGVPPQLHAAINLQAVALVTALHIVLSGGMGLTAALLVRAVDPDRNRPVLATLLMFGIVEGGFLLGATVVASNLPAVLGYLRVALVNLTAAAAMIAWVHHAGRVEEEARQESIHREAHHSPVAAGVEKTTV
jgi:hypothetical protein